MINKITLQNGKEALNFKNNTVHPLTVSARKKVYNKEGKLIDGVAANDKTVYITSSDLQTKCYVNPNATAIYGDFSYFNKGANINLRNKLYAPNCEYFFLNSSCLSRATDKDMILSLPNCKYFSAEETSNLAGNYISLRELYLPKCEKFSLSWEHIKSIDDLNLPNAIEAQIPYQVKRVNIPKLGYLNKYSEIYFAGSPLEEINIEEFRGDVTLDSTTRP